MKPKIVSLNSGKPASIEWQGKSIMSSMLRLPVEGPLTVHEHHIDGNTYTNTNVHGTPDSVLYAYGVKSAMVYMKLLGRDTYVPGSLGENITLDDFDETQISVGDIFKFGEVWAQVVYPRIPCSKLNYRLQDDRAQKMMQECGLSGVYFRILKPGKIHKTDEVYRIESAEYPFLISHLYQKMVNGISFDHSEMEVAVANGAFPARVTKMWLTKLGR
jgi:MOSC domain-containing protein YiiM